MAGIPERFKWAVEMMEIKEEDHILEIGCGAGILTDAIARQLKTGTVQAIDKSAAMVAKAEKRNKAHIDSGKAEFIVTDFLQSNLPGHYFDDIVAFNVNFFLKDSRKELKAIRHALKPGGHLYVFYQEPQEIDETAAEPIKAVLVKYGFDIVNTVLKKLATGSAICVTATEQH